MGGEIVEPQKVYVDIGTGYYVLMSTARAADYYKRKIEFIEGQLTQIANMKIEVVKALKKQQQQ